MGIGDKIRAYIRKESKINLFFNALFFILLLLILIPSTRIEILPRIQRIFLFSPSAEKEEERVQLSPKDLAWEFKAYDGSTQTLAEANKKVIFLNLWATWCPPCVAEMPNIQKLFDDYNDKIEFVFITNESQHKVDSFMKKHEFNLPIYKMAYRLPPALHSESLPTTYIIDKEGKVVVQKVGTANWNSKKVRSLLDELIAK